MSQQDLNDFADWLMANPDKKGTAQYQTIAKFSGTGQPAEPTRYGFSSAFPVRLRRTSRKHGYHSKDAGL